MRTHCRVNRIRFASIQFVSFRFSRRLSAYFVMRPRKLLRRAALEGQDLRKSLRMKGLQGQTSVTRVTYSPSSAHYGTCENRKQAFTGFYETLLAVKSGQSLCILRLIRPLTGCFQMQTIVGLDTGIVNGISCLPMTG